MRIDAIPDSLWVQVWVQCLDVRTSPRPALPARVTAKSEVEQKPFLYPSSASHLLYLLETFSL